jgi:hypothetical protein
MREDNSLRTPLMLAGVLAVGFPVVLGVYLAGQTDTGAGPEREREAEGGGPFLPPSPPDNGAVLTCDPPERVSWADAERNVGNRVAMVGPVIDGSADNGTLEFRIGQEEAEEEP